MLTGTGVKAVEFLDGRDTAFDLVLALGFGYWLFFCLCVLCTAPSGSRRSGMSVRSVYRD
ncbi:hypothetical protein BJY04DRAFT_200971 [Aspergillus karnatakaensis]|uniref:uncharacterized protein n=1 Tax=Aspergillus karnatakaensis TaxID=1810916 RepID=UPI003CCDCF5B